LIFRSEVEVERTSKFVISSRDLSLLFAITLIVGGFIFLFIPNNVLTANASYVFQRMWGTHGSGNGQFDGPAGVAVDSSGNVFVLDNGNHRVQKFRISSTCPTGTTQVVSGVCFVGEWGTQGAGPGQFKWPNGIGLDSSGNVYVADTFNHRIQKFTNTGAFIRTWGTVGSANGQFVYPTDVAVDSSGNVFVVDEGNNRVQKFTSTGTFIRTWGTGGKGPSQFNYPQNVAVDAAGNVFVADSLNSRVQEFTNKGAFIKAWGTQGTGPGQFKYPYGLAIDSSGNVFVADGFNHRVEKFTNTGSFLTAWGTQGTGPGQFGFPGDLDVTNPGFVVFKEYVYVTEVQNNRIQVFAWKPDVQATNFNLKTIQSNNTAVTSR
jgi:tripartite motif-containing protein 71